METTTSLKLILGQQRICKLFLSFAACLALAFFQCTFSNVDVALVIACVELSAVVFWLR